MASDANLIKGAGQVAYGAANAIKQQGSGLDALSGAAAKMQQNQLAETKAETAAQKDRNLDMDGKLYDTMELVNASSQNLSEQHYNEVKNAVEGLKMDYDACGFSDEGCKREVMAKMNAQTQRMNQQKELRDGNKEAYNNGLLSGSLSDEEKNIMAIYMDPNASEYTLKYDKDPMDGGQAIYEIANSKYNPDLPESDTNKKTIEYTEGDITKMFDKQIDVKGKEASSAYGVTMMEDGLNGKEYNANKTTQKYNDMITTENIHSFTHDDMGFGSLKNDIMTEGGPIDEAIMAAANDPNSNFGLEPGPGDEGNWYDNIDDNDRKMIFDALTNRDRKGIDPVTGEEVSLYDADLHKKTVVDYYQRMSAKNHAEGKAQKDAADKARIAEAEEKERIRVQELNLEYGYKYDKMNKLTEEELGLKTTGGAINDIASLSINQDLKESDFAGLDGLKGANSKAGSLGMYVRKNPNGEGFVVYEGDPDSDTENQEYTELPTDPNAMAQKLFNMYGIPGQHLKVQEVDYENNPRYNKKKKSWSTF